jgi:uncharacterized membrane-anchored protein YjiN (DUF445 family)
MDRKAVFMVPDELFTAIVRFQGSFLDDADTLTRRDLGEVLEQLGQGQAVDPATLERVREHLTQAILRLHVFSREVVRRLEREPGRTLALCVQVTFNAETCISAKVS